MELSAAAARLGFLQWKQTSRLTWDDVAALVEKRGGKVKARTLDHIARGRRRPSYELAVILADVTGIAVPKWMALKAIGTGRTSASEDGTVGKAV